jgi:nitrogen regulatory protein PII
LPKIKVEIAIEGEALDRILETILRSAGTGQIGDGKIFVSDLENVVRIRTGESGKDAI